jgi:hypothetical protein
MVRASSAELFSTMTFRPAERNPKVLFSRTEPAIRDPSCIGCY